MGPVVAMISRGRRYWRASTALATPLLAGIVITASAPGLFHISVRQGDTLWALAHRYHTSVAKLVALNHLPGNGNFIYPGEVLAVPAPPPPPTVWRAYRVVPGDTVDGIAARFKVPVTAIAGRNHLSGAMTVYIGQTLWLPETAPAAPAAPAAAWRRPGAPTGGPDRATVRAMLIDAAHAYGVDPNLVLAVAWQESGWNQDTISSSGALGAMQVEPNTGRFVASYLLHRPVNLYSAADNIDAGVALLALLTREAPIPAAVAGYYQGLDSVRKRGMWPETKRYVADVLALRARFAGD
ncbi:MAG: lytic transglycosylase [Mycobacteriales bacterium]